jgi:hypothetical protein
MSVTKIEAWGLKAEFDKGLDKIDSLTPPVPELPAPAPAFDPGLQGEPPPPNPGPPYPDAPYPTPGPSPTPPSLDAPYPAPAQSPTPPYPEAPYPAPFIHAGGEAASLPSRAVSPEMIVLEAWGRLEGSVRPLIEAKHPSLSRRQWAAARAIEEVARDLGLSEDEIQSLRVMRRLRNEVAHSDSSHLTWEEALRFKNATKRFTARLIQRRDSRSENENTLRSASTR